MQYKFVAAALLASIPFAAVAQSNVTIYGIADAALAAENSGSQKVLKLSNGNRSSSRLGFRGTEDLGGGLNALFNLEAGIKIDTGEGNIPLFNRRAIVGLEGGFGALTMGREYSPIDSVVSPSDIMELSFFGGSLSAFDTNRLTRRLDNSINYKTPSFGGVVARLAYSLGEQVTGPSKDLLGLAVNYTNGPLFVGAGYHTLRRVATGDDKEYAVGAGYKFSAFDVKANYLVADQDGASNKFEQFNLGASAGLGEGRLYANLQQNKIENGARGKGYAIAYAHPLSTRTSLYASYATVRNNDTGAFRMSSSGTNVSPTNPGDDPSVYTVGMRHLF